MSLSPAATDEDIAGKALGDWPIIAPPAQRLAEGRDGVFSSGDRWTLASATNDFATMGVVPGNVVILPAGTTYKNDLLVVDSVATGTATLRRRAMTTGLGVPPGSVTGNTGVSFAIHTMMPQIVDETFLVARMFNIQSSDDLQDADDLRWRVVYAVLRDIYFEAARNVEQRSDDFAGKGRLYGQMANRQDEILSRVYKLDQQSATFVGATLGKVHHRSPFSHW